MRKVYLVICCMTADYQNFEYVREVYSNKKQALISCEYHNLKYGYAGLDKTKGFRVEEMFLSTIDWTDDLVKLKMERNPL